MPLDEEWLRLIIGIGDFTKEATGVSIVDAYFGPKSLSPERIKQVPSSDELLDGLNRLIDRAKEIEDELRRLVITSDLQSLKVVVKWLSGDNIPYIQLVKGIFGITPSKFGQAEICRAQQRVEYATEGLPGSGAREKVLKWREKSNISGEALKKMIDKEIVKHTKEIERLFKKRVFSHLQVRFTNRGVIYKAVTGEPWGAYNYYQGNYTSVNAINLDRTHNRHRLIGVLAHEYEHHIANAFTERYYKKTRALDMCVALLHSKRSVISEGTADCARNFLGMKPTEHSELLEALGTLGSMVNLNASYMLNVENADENETAEYIFSEGFIPVEEARKSLRFTKSLSPDGRPNLFKPYIYTYHFGRADYVLPTFQKAQRKGKMKEFFQTLYLNPYSRSSATWKTAFSGI